MTDLRRERLVGLVESGAVFVAAHRDTVCKLDVLCLGTLDGAADAAARVRAELSAAGTSPSAAEADQVVRLGAEETFFMVHAAGILEVYATHGAHGTATNHPLDSEVCGGVVFVDGGRGRPQDWLVVPCDVLGRVPCERPAVLTPPVAPQPRPYIIPGVPAFQDLWCLLRRSRADFPLLYLGYHHYRSKV